MSRGQIIKTARKLIRRHLRAVNADPYGITSPKHADLVETARQHLNLPNGLFAPAGSTGSSAKNTLLRIAVWLRTGKITPVDAKPLKKIHKKDLPAFYRSIRWRALRWDVLEKYGFQCMACGRNAADGLKLHVDHIRPLKHFPELALDPDNLQVLCEECNHGKGARSEADLRPKWAALSSNGHYGENGAGAQGKRVQAGSDQSTRGVRNGSSLVA